MTRIHAHAVLLGVLIFGTAPPAAGEEPPMSERARAHLEVGLTHFRAKNYEAAIDEFQRGYAAEPRPEFLFAMAQAERLSGDCATALERYREFLERDPPEKQARAARDAIARCRRALGPQLSARAEEPTPTDREVPRALELSPRAAPDPQERQFTPWYRDPVGAALLTGGVAAVAVGAGFYFASSADETAAADAGTYGRYDDLIARAGTRRTYAWVGMGGGAALLAGAGLRYLLRDRGDEGGARIAVTATDRGAGLVLCGNF